MDVRLSPEQQALRDSAAQLVERLGPRAVRDLEDTERVAKLDAAVEASGWRDLRAAIEGGAPLASAVEAAIVAEELGRALVDVPFLGPTLAAELRLAGAPPCTSRETVALLTQAWTALGLALTCANLVGTMDGAIRLACDYARSRRQYGAAIGCFQAVQRVLADAFVAMEGSRSAALHATWAVDALAAREAVAAASVPKAYCSRAARTVCEITIQVHGGIGNTWDCLAHVYLRRALLSIDLLGGVGPSVARVLEHNGMGGRHGLR